MCLFQPNEENNLVIQQQEDVTAVEGESIPLEATENKQSGSIEESEWQTALEMTEETLHLEIPVA